MVSIWETVARKNKVSLKGEVDLRSKLRSHFAIVLALIAAAVLLAIDQATKFFVLRDLQPKGPFSVIAGFLELVYVENSGAAFGLFQNNVLVLSIVAIAVTITLVFLLVFYRSHTAWSLLAGAMLLAGGIGNIIDRIRFGFVVDFIHVLFFPFIFNFADCCITVGTVCFVMHVLLVSHREHGKGNDDG